MSALEVIVETPSRDYQTYTYDYQAQSLRLVESVYLGQRLAGDLAIIPNTLTPQSRPLDMLLVVNYANAPKVRVDAWPIGLLRVHDGDTTDEVIIAIPKADTTLTHVTTIDELAEVRRMDIEHFIATSGLTNGQPPRIVKWFGVHEADRAIYEARRAAKVAKAKQPKTAHAPAWKPTIREAQPSETHAIHTVAELSLFSLPPRFQDYVGDLLLPDERLLHFISRKPLKQEREGVLVVTDQQVLWMTDVITPQLSVVAYGYVAKVGVHERLEAVRMNDDALYPQLVLTWRASTDETETYTVSFHPEQSAEVKRVGELLTRFLPPADMRRLRRVFVPDPDEQRGAAFENADDMPNAPAALERPRARRAPCLSSDEWIRAEGLAIDFSSGAATLLSVTNQRALLVCDKGEPQTIDFARVASMELGFSVMGPWLSISQAEGQRIVQTRTEIPLIAFTPFNRCFLAMRQALLSQCGCS